MSPRFPGRDLRLERLDGRDGLRPAHLGEVGQSAPAQAGEWQSTYEALIDAVFCSPGAAEWLLGLGVTVAALVARPPGQRVAPTSEAIRAAESR